MVQPHGQVARTGTGFNPSLLHTILSEGKVVGHWKETIHVTEVTVDTFFYRPLASEERISLAKAVNRLGDFFGLTARLS